MKPSIWIEACERARFMWKAKVPGGWLVLIADHLGDSKAITFKLQRGLIVTDRKQTDLLKRGVQEWNAWRGEHPAIRPNLSWANLRKADLTYANLREAELSCANLCKADLSWANLSGAALSCANLRKAELIGANLCQADLGGAYLSGACLSGAELIGANLRMADLRETSLNETYLNEANLLRTDLTGTDLSSAMGLTRRQIAEAKTDETTKLPEYLDS
jgi:hypothetical protein